MCFRRRETGFELHIAMLISILVYRSQVRENVLHDRSNHRILLCRSPFSQAADVPSIFLRTVASWLRWHPARCPQRCHHLPGVVSYPAQAAGTGPRPQVGLGTRLRLHLVSPEAHRDRLSIATIFNLTFKAQPPLHWKLIVVPSRLITRLDS